MIKHWINKSGNPTCILFFNGWGMDKNAISHLDFENYDVLMHHNYSSFNTDLSELNNYDNLILIAWSMGVFAASQTLKNTELKFSKSIALNGTENPMSNDFGIPVDVFLGTLNNWSLPNRVRFNARVFGGRKTASENYERLPKRDSENQKAELAFLYQEIEKLAPVHLNWNCTLIGSSDLIFTTQNQLNYWDGKCEIIERDLPHFPFSNFTNWQQIIDL